MSRTRIQMSRTQSYPPLFPFEGDTVAKVARVTDSLSHLNVTNLDVWHELIYVTNSSRTVAKGARVANSLTQMSHTQSFPTHFFFWWCCCERRDLFYINFTNSYPIVTNSKTSPLFLVMLLQEVHMVSNSLPNVTNSFFWSLFFWDVMLPRGVHAMWYTLLNATNSIYFSFLFSSEGDAAARSHAANPPFCLNFTNSYPIVPNSKKTAFFFSKGDARGEFLKLFSKCHELIILAFFYFVAAALLI